MADAHYPMTAALARKLWHYDPATGVFRWRITASTKAKQGQIAGTRDEYGYTILRYAGKGYKAHRMAWLYVYGAWPGPLIDHINQDKSDNRITNLREADATDNLMNVSCPCSNTTSGVRGVSWFSQYRKWKASIMHRGRKYFLGHFDTIPEAQAAYLSAKQKLIAGEPLTLRRYRRQAASPLHDRRLG
ncbi:MAG: HNH endonuclease [Rhodospirillaceae bacterium]